MRISSATVALLFLAGCGDNTADHGPIAEAEAQAAADRSESGEIECAASGTAAMARRCTVDRVQTAAGTELTLRQPDGGFHRLLVTRDGRGVIAADGAEPAVVSVAGDSLIEVAIGGARYRLPATVK